MSAKNAVRRSCIYSKVLTVAGHFASPVFDISARSVCDLLTLQARQVVASAELLVAVLSPFVRNLNVRSCRLFATVLPRLKTE